MAPERAARAAQVFRALGDPTRVQMVHMLRASVDPICICDFTAAFELSQPTVSHHMARLRAAGLVTSYRRGIWTFYRLDPELPVSVAAAVAAVP
ncbi:MAG TPA: metalloregulator ArsR/SmtB family transcription factor [Verrucomicrobiae bacterium]|nr:metalloregulator ArsR/SmtB family transcription factor [Verrucomicrobiae bacterium]